MKIRMIVACTNAQGAPDFFCCIVQCSEDEYEAGDHYDRAKAAAREDGYSGELVAFDEYDQPTSILQLFWASHNWTIESIYTIE